MEEPSVRTALGQGSRTTVTTTTKRGCRGRRYERHIWCSTSSTLRRDIASLAIKTENYSSSSLLRLRKRSIGFLTRKTRLPHLLGRSATLSGHLQSREPSGGGWAQSHIRGSEGDHSCRLRSSRRAPRSSRRAALRVTLVMVSSVHTQVLAEL